MDSRSLPNLVIKYFHGFGGSELQQVVISNNLGDKYLFFQLGVQFILLVVTFLLILGERS